jgi:hypothetical protein
MSNTLTSLIKKIQFSKDLTIEQVAKSIDYTRQHLSREMKKGNVDIEQKLKETYKDVDFSKLQNVTSHATETDTIRDLARANISLSESNRIAIEANREAVSANKEAIATNKTLADSNRELVQMLKNQFSSNAPASQHPSDLMEPYLYKIAKAGLVEKRWKSLDEGLLFLGKSLKESAGVKT